MSMDGQSLVLIAVLMALAAMLYSSVGHGGASAYLAIMALFAVAPATMRPTALALNIVVASLAAFVYLRSGQFNGRLFLAFALAGIPCAFIGGMLQVSPEIYRPLVGAVLWAAAARLFWNPVALADGPVKPASLTITVPTGGALGLLAGLTGTGGGIFLSPLILLLRWEEPRRTSGVVAAFILVNSAAGLAGNLASVQRLPPELPWLAGAVGFGALAGVLLGSRWLPRSALLRALAVVLAIAGWKLIFT